MYPSAPPYQEYPPRPQEFPAMPAQEYHSRPQEFPAMPAMSMPQPMPMPYTMPIPPDPQPPMYYPSYPASVPPPPPAPTVIFGSESVTMTCPHCNCQIATETSKTHGICTHVCCVFLFCTGALTLCSCLPYFLCDAETVEHTCPNCHARLGVWSS